MKGANDRCTSVTGFSTHANPGCLAWHVVFPRARPAVRHG